MKPKIKKILKIAGEVIILALVLGCFFYSLYKVIIYAARENLKFSLPWVKGAYFEIVAPPNPPRASHTARSALSTAMLCKSDTYSDTNTDRDTKWGTFANADGYAKA